MPVTAKHRDTGRWALTALPAVIELRCGDSETGVRNGRRHG
jgi:hypothetical protein